MNARTRSANLTKEPSCAGGTIRHTSRTSCVRNHTDMTVAFIPLATIGSLSEPECRSVFASFFPDISHSYLSSPARRSFSPSTFAFAKASRNTVALTKASRKPGERALISCCSCSRSVSTPTLIVRTGSAKIANQHRTSSRSSVSNHPSWMTVPRTSGYPSTIRADTLPRTVTFGTGADVTPPEIGL